MLAVLIISSVLTAEPSYAAEMFEGPHAVEQCEDTAELYNLEIALTPSYNGIIYAECVSLDQSL